MNARITSANVREFYGIFTFRFTFWAFFDTNEFYLTVSLSDYSRFRSKFTTQRVTKVRFLL